MLQIMSNPFGAGAAAFIASVLLTYAVRRVAHRTGFVAKPKSDRWHKRETATMGGVAIFLATLLMYTALVPSTAEIQIVIGASAFLFLVGLLDDVLNIKPYHKLIGQLIGATIVVGYGLRLPLTGYELVDIWITLFWLIGITNAINLLDNMDGLAA